MAQLDFATESSFVDVVGDLERRDVGLLVLGETNPLDCLAPPRRFPSERDEVARWVARAFGPFGWIVVTGMPAT
jgi:hypothetical protein